MTPDATPTFDIDAIVAAAHTAREGLASARAELDRSPAPNGPTARLAYAAAHLTMRAEYADVAHRVTRPGSPDDLARYIDWDTTLEHRRRLDDLGFGIAEAMDTAQRFEIGWPTARRLIDECGKLSPTNGFIAGAGVDSVDPAALRTVEDVADTVVRQGEHIQAAGGVVILLPIGWLPARDLDADSYVDAYARVIRRLDGPLCIHWLGAMFAPDLEGYFPGDSFARIMAIDPRKVRGCKISLLDADREIRIRRELAEHDQVVFTGDDFHYDELIVGHGSTHGERTVPFGERSLPLGDFSHALLGILDGIADPASLALRQLDRGDRDAARRTLAATTELSRRIFEAPTRHYKAGLAFVAWLNGWQPNRMLVNHAELERDFDHYGSIARLAASAGALVDPDAAGRRLRELGRR